MVNRVNLVNIPQHTVKDFFCCDENFLRFTLLATSNMQYNTNHAVPYLPRTYLFNDWKFVPFDPLNPFHSLPSNHFLCGKKNASY